MERTISRLSFEELEQRIAPGGANGLQGYEGQPGNQGNGLNGYEGQPGNQGGHGGNPSGSANPEVPAGNEPQPNP